MHGDCGHNGESSLSEASALNSLLLSGACVRQDVVSGKGVSFSSIRNAELKMYTIFIKAVYDMVLFIMLKEVLLKCWGAR